MDLQPPKERIPSKWMIMPLLHSVMGAASAAIALSLSLHCIFLFCTHITSIPVLLPRGAAPPFLTCQLLHTARK